MYYLSTTNQYLGTRLLLTPEELELCDEEEKKWREEQQNYTLHQWLKIFPQGKLVITHKLKDSIKENKIKLSQLQEQRIETLNKKARVPNDQLWIYEHIIEGIDRQIKETVKKIKKNYFLLSSLKKKPIDKTTGKITEEGVARAKECPVENFYQGKLRKQGSNLVGLCPLHNEKDPSFTIYTKTNRWYCYGENAGGDVIDLVAKLNNCSFLEAVKIILHL